MSAQCRVHNPRVALQAQFYQAAYRIASPGPPIELHIADRSAALDRRLKARQATGLAIVTAWNPGGRRAPPLVNRIRQRRLAADLRRQGLTWWPAVNAPDDPRWSEPAFAVPTLHPSPVTRLARRYGQAAIVWYPKGGRTRLVWVAPRRLTRPARGAGDPRSRP